jgi:glycosyltransferase involved in cell wall biosynthesis
VATWLKGLSDPSPSIETGEAFDAVVMMTWSDWRHEPRSNRYHYATRFARQFPVYFVQPDSTDGSICLEPVEGRAITLVHTPPAYDDQAARALVRFFATLGVRRPLLWIYNVFFEKFIRRSGARLKVFHATEDYLTKPEGFRAAGDELRAPLLRVLRDVDLVVAVSQGVFQSYREIGQYHGRAIVLRNGCDFDFWKASGAATFAEPADGARVALYQGGVNARLDYALLGALAQSRPDWQFWFCGRTRDGGADWSSLSRRPNVRHFGELDPDGVARLARQALIGLMPFKQNKLIRVSLPLKAWEYVACGLPVVTTPIDALASRPDLFRFETTPEGFANALDELAATRNRPELVALRLAAAAAESYDRRFLELEDCLRAMLAERAAARPRLNLLMLYDDHSTYVRTIFEHLEAFQKYSRHHIVLMAGAAGSAKAPLRPDFSAFDAVLIHYSIRVSVLRHLSPAIAEAVAAYGGPKILFAQDEYENTETTRGWIERLGIDTLFTSVPLDEVEKVYPGKRFPRLAFVPTLTGYVPEVAGLDQFALPLSERRILIGYRGRRLPHHYGALGHEKWRIGVEMKRITEQRGLPVDIEVDDSRRIYGDDWYRFLGSCRATLGTESGANVFDDDGSLKRLAAAKSETPFESFAAEHLAGRDGEVRMNQVSPKIFEAIRLRTALVLFEGDYSGAIQRDRHYISLARDFSNVDDVIAKLNDAQYLSALTERAYAEVIGGGRYSYRTFVEGFDAHIDGYGLARARARLHTVPLFAVFGERDVSPMWDWSVAEAAIGDEILGARARRRYARISRRLARNLPAVAKSAGTKGRIPADLTLEESRLERLIESIKSRARAMPRLIGALRWLRGIDSAA